MATAAPYDDGSSTESEYYFDPREEAEEEAACAWAHEHIVPKTHEPLSHGNEDSTVIKQEYSAYDAENITLPQGSEWSHGAAASTVYDNAVQQALAMAQELTGVQREDPLTDDTLNSNASPIEKKKEHEEKQEKNMAVLKKKEVEVKPKLVSLKSVKAQTPPASMTKAVAVGLRRSPSRVKGASSEMRKELSVARSQWKSTESQTSVFKLKLQEADADEKLSCEPLSVAEIALYERRRNKIAVERARLEAQNLERFEKVYATTRVSNVALKRYQDNRDFAWRVICFKERQASLQQQKDLLVSEEMKREKWRQLDEDRESLLAENSYMFHTVMMENGGEFQHRENADTNMSRRSGKRASGGEIQRGQPKFKRRAAEVIQPNFADSTTSSRVVIGAALQLKGNGIPSSTFDRSRPKNTPWFLKG
ncbi:hypothetical protein PC129_g4786 [Phytophthora cactorum]|uniref:Uncharacterized protein n=1 Tax=Phytophthora cactorum TaxID=29920 RepID=A0A8T1DA51_9STRA|nr:hypothetical protein PC115_g4538 [Phytophthora cactorum]KAG3224560.1 hypothetical protein PC129_g4786 [Phytophthora cactorum]